MADSGTKPRSEAWLLEQVDFFLMWSSSAGLKAHVSLWFYLLIISPSGGNRFQLYWWLPGICRQRGWCGSRLIQVRGPGSLSSDSTLFSFSRKVFAVVEVLLICPPSIIPKGILRHTPSTFHFVMLSLIIVKVASRQSNKEGGEA